MPRPPCLNALRGAHQRFVAWMGAVFAALALVLALTGVYGLTADAVQRSTRDIGIRKALGAESGDIARGYLWRSARIAILCLLKRRSCCGC